MPHLIGIQFHTDGLSVAALRPDQTIVLRPVTDMASIIQRTSALGWKWSFGVDEREANAILVAHELLLGLQHAMGDDHILAGVAVPATWGDRQRRALLQAMEGTTLEAMRLVRDTTALAVTAALINPTIAGLCAVAHVGAHKLEFALADVSAGTIRVRARQSVVGLDGTNMRPETLLPLVTEVANFVTRQAGVRPSDVRRFVCAGKRAAQPTLANALGAIFGIPPEVLPDGAIALGAAHVAVGLTGMSTPWNLLDDLDEPALANLRGKPRRRATVSPLPPAARVEALTPRERPDVPAIEELPVFDAARATAPPAGLHDLRETIVQRSPLPPTTAPRPTVAPTSIAPTSVAPTSVAPTDERPSDAARISEHPSFAPPSGHVAEVAASGPFVGLASLDSVRALHLVNPVEADALARPSLATLFNQFTFLRAASGVLSLRHRAEEIAIPIDRGGVCLSPAERSRDLRAFEWAEGTYSFRREKHPWQTQKLRTPMTAFVVAGLRMRLRGFEDAAFTQTHLTKLRLAPSVIDDRRSRLARLVLPEAEDRAVDYVLDGSRSFETMLSEGYIGRTTMHRLVVLLDLYGILHWAQPTAAAVENPVAVMTRLLAKIEGNNHFIALGVHWSAPTDEIRQCWEKMQTLYGMGGSWQRHDPSLAARILQRASAAWAVLRLDATRVRHRREAYPGMDEELLAPLVESRAKALEMRGESSEAARMMQLRGEFHVAAPVETPKAKR